MKLGELLIADGILTPTQVEHALRAQVMWGGRLGTNLVELGYVDLDGLSRALGRQHKLPAALARHFERGDRELQRLLSPDFAERFACVPLLRVGQTSDCVVAVVDPLATKPNAIVADELGVDPAQVIQSVAAELRIRYHLERIYQIPRGTRFLRSRGPSIPIAPALDIAPELPATTSAPDYAIPITVDEGDGDGLTAPVSIATVISAPPPRDDTPPPAAKGKPPSAAAAMAAAAAKAAASKAPKPAVPAGRPPTPAEWRDSAPGVKPGGGPRAIPSVLTKPAPVEPPTPATSIAIEAVSPVPVKAPPPPVPEPELEPEPEPELIDDTPPVEEAEAVAEGGAEQSLDDIPAFTEASASGPTAAPIAPITEESSGRDRRQYVRTLADMVDPAVPSGLDHKTLGRIAIRRVAVNAEPNAASTFPEATRAIRRATDRERIAELVMAAIDRYAPTCEAAMLLVVRGEAAIGWKGFVRDNPPPPEFAVPLDRPGLVVVARKNQTARCAAADLGQIDRLLLEALGHDKGDLVIVPIGIAGQVICMIATATAPDAPVAAVEAVAAAAGAAFARLLHTAGR